MKKHNFSTVRNILTSAILASVLIISTSAKASDKKIEDISPVEVKYLGQLNDQPLFQINVDNNQKEEMFVNLEDENGNILYSGKFSTSKFSRKFQFSSLDLDGTKIKLSINSNSVKKSEVFEINNETKVVTEVVVTKVD